MSHNPVDSNTQDAAYELSFAQQRFWFLDQMESREHNHSFYNVSLILRAKGPLDQPAMERALQDLQIRHEVLRAIYEPTETGLPVMKFTDRRVGLTVLDLSHLPAQEVEANGLEAAIAECQRPFDLHLSPPWRLSVIKLAADDHLMAVSMHHIISDIWSIRVFMHDLGQLYRSAVTGSPVELEPIARQYTDFAAWQRDFLLGGELDKLTDYWRKKIASSQTATVLPIDFERGAVRTMHGKTLNMDLPKELSPACHQLCRRFGVTPYILLLSVFKTLLHRYTGDEDIIIGTEIANRHHEGTDTLIGPFVNQLVLRSDLGANPTFAEVVERIKKTVFESFQHQDMPFDKLVDALKPERKANLTPFFQIKFLYNSLGISAQLFPELELSGVELPIEVSPFDLTLRMAKDGQRYFAELTYNTDLYKEETMTSLLRHYQVLLQNIIADPDQHLNQLAYMSEEEQLQREKEKAERKQAKRDTLKSFKRR